MASSYEVEENLAETGNDGKRMRRFKINRTRTAPLKIIVSIAPRMLRRARR